MATNFGTKTAINAYSAFLQEITRMPLLITGGFRGRSTNPNKTFLIARV